jgi:hypothetical protein
MLRVELAVYDYLIVDHPEVSDFEYKKLLSEKQTVLLQWNRIANRFQLAGKKKKQK